MTKKEKRHLKYLLNKENELIGMKKWQEIHKRICPKCQVNKMQYRSKLCHSCNLHKPMAQNIVEKKTATWKKNFSKGKFSMQNSYWKGRSRKEQWTIEARLKLSKTNKLRALSESQKKHFKRIGILSHLAQSFHSPTSIERKVYEALDEMGITFKRQYPIGNIFLVDAYIPNLNLVIEADGDYWHSLPKSIIKDKSKNTYLQSHGYNLLRLTEKEINEGTFINKIRETTMGDMSRIVQD